MKTRTGYLVKRGGTYYACWTISGKKFRQSTHKRDKREAQTRLAEIMQPYLVEDEVRTLESVKARIEGAKGELRVLDEKRHPPLTIAGAWAAYVNAPNRPDSGEATLATYGLQWGCFVRWLAEHHPALVHMRDVTTIVAEAYAGHLNARKVTANTFNKHVRVCLLIFRVLRDKARMAGGNPWAELTRKKLSPHHRRELSTDELKSVCQRAEGELRTLLCVGLYTGMRLGDAATLEWGAVDLPKGLLRYMPSKTARRSAKVLTVPLHPVLHAVLSETPPPARKGNVLPDLARRYTERGPYAVAEIVQKHFEDCGIRTVKAGTGMVMKQVGDGKARSVSTGKRAVVEVGFHSLRHSAVSLLREAGAPLSVTMGIVGHSTLAMHDTYTHAGAEAMQRAVASLPSVMGGDIKALPSADPLVALKASVRALAETLTPTTAPDVRQELLALAGVAAE